MAPNRGDALEYVVEAGRPQNVHDDIYTSTTFLTRTPTSNRSIPEDGIPRSEIEVRQLV